MTETTFGEKKLCEVFGPYPTWYDFEGEEFTSYTAAQHQVAIKMFRLHLWHALISSVF